MSECIPPFDPCKWCGSRRHRSVACRIKAKHQMLMDGATPEEAGFVVIDTTKPMAVLTTAGKAAQHLGEIHAAFHKKGNPK